MPNRGRNELAGTVPSSTSNCRVLISTDSDALTQLDTPRAAPSIDGLLVFKPLQRAF